MLNYTFGATAQFMITDQISLNADLSVCFSQRSIYAGGTDSAPGSWNKDTDRWIHD